MSDNINSSLDLLDSNPSEVTYAGFWERVGASMIDGLLISAIVLPFSYFNFTDWKSPAALVIVSILAMIYKPFLEFQYGATIGKKALKIKIVSYQHEPANLTEVLLRNSPLLAISALSLVLSLSLFTMPGFEEVKTYTEYTTFVSENKSMGWVRWVSWGYYFADIVTFFAGDRKRTLHDIIGKTYAIKVND